LISRSTALEFEIKGLETVRARFQRDVALLGSDRPDADLVEEIARDTLGLVDRSDRVAIRH
jgi:cell division protein FtsB